MKSIGYRTRKVKDALLECPSLIPILLRDGTFNPKITKGILYNLIPRRTSIEIESFGKIPIPPKYAEEYPKYQYLTKELKVLEIRKDSEDGNNAHQEFKISIINYSQAIGLYKFLELMKEHCQLNPDSGSHIHVNIQDIMLKVYNKKNDLQQDSFNSNIKSFFNKWMGASVRKNETEFFFNKFITDGTLDRIFGPYNGTYNERCFTFRKKGVISFREDYGSIEFRWAPQTFDYTTIIKWYIECNKIINQFSKLIDELLAKDKSPIFIHPHKNSPLDERLRYHLRKHADCNEDEVIRYSTDRRITGLNHFYSCRECNPV